MKSSNSQQSRSILVPATEGVKYAGSKLKLLPHIIPVVCGLRGVDTVLDGFSGSTRVSQALYQTGRFRVVSNDISVWSEIFARCYLQADRPASYYQSLLDRLNALEGREGWFTQTYNPPALPIAGTTPDGAEQQMMVKQPFQRKNLLRLDAIREEIALWRSAGEIDGITESVLLTSLMLALDRVDSTLGHFTSYLRQWSKRSYGDLTLTLPRLCDNPKVPQAEVTRGDIFDLLHGDEPRTLPQLAGTLHSATSPKPQTGRARAEALGDGDRLLAYYDPPYGSNNTKMPPSRVRYASYYHFWTSVVLNDRPAVFGRAGRREDSRDGVSASVFEDYHASADGRHVAMDAIERLIVQTPARYILLSYSSSGRATRDELLDILHAHGRLRQTFSLDHAHHVMSRMQWTQKWLNADDDHKEYLFLLEK